MKFLTNVTNNQNIMPLNIIYDPGNKYRDQVKDDWIDILYKDIDSGEKFVETIVHPKIELWITKQEFRNYDYNKDWITKDEVFPIIVPYKERYREVAKILNIPIGDVKTSPYVFQLDMQLEHFYLSQFMLEYGNDKLKTLNVGVFDIENDMWKITSGSIAPYGEAPIDCVTFISINEMRSYTLILTTDNLPNTLNSDPDHDLIEQYRKNFHTTMNELKENPKILDDLFHEKFDEIYGVLDYQFYFYDSEIELIVAFFQLVEMENIDFLGGWNSVYDFGHMEERPKHLGYDPNSFIISKKYPKLPDGLQRNIVFQEDKNPLAHKRKHIFKFYTTYVCSDNMVNYSGIRSARGKLPSLALNAIAKKELKDEKIDHSEVADFREFKYKDLIKFILYNAKDVLLLMGLEKKTHDFNAIYQTMIDDICLPNEVFTTTREVEGSFRQFAFTYKKGYVLGSNRHKWESNALIDYQKMADDILGITNEQDIFLQKDDFNENILIEEIDEEEQDIYDPSDYEINLDSDTDSRGMVSVKFAGAHVQNVEHVTPTGVIIAGKEAKYVHDNVGDQDVTSEYPSGVMEINASNESMFGKVFFASNSIEMPLYPGYELIGDDDVAYKKIDQNAWVMEQLSTGDTLNLGHIMLNLPEVDAVLEKYALEVLNYDKEIIE